MPRNLQNLFRVEIALRSALWLILLTVVATTKTDPDLWGHVRFGMDIIRDGTIRQTDTYSFTSDRQWINHEWAAEVVSGAGFMAAGSAGLVLMKLAVVLGILLLLNAMLKWDGVGESRHRDMLVAAAVITTIQQAHNVRPQLFSLVFFTILLALLLLSLGNPRRLLALPVLFAVWANFHGGWIVGGGVLILWTLGVAVSKSFGARTAMYYVAAGVASLAATLINPEGPGLLFFLRETVGFGRAEIVDWQPVYALSPAIWGLWILTAALAGFGVVRSWRHRLQPERLLVVLTLAVASFRVNRLLAFFALATVMLLGSSIASVFPRKQSSSGARRRAPGAVAAIVAALLFAAGLRMLFVNGRCLEVDPATSPEPGAVAFFNSHGSSGRLLVWFDWSQYAIWHLAPRFRVSIDGRRETVYSAGILDRHLRFFFDAPGGAALPQEIAADYVWVPKDLPAARRLAADGWMRVYLGEKSAIFTRAAGAPPELPQQPANAVRRCFPNP